MKLKFYQIFITVALLLNIQSVYAENEYLTAELLDEVHTNEVLLNLSEEAPIEDELESIDIYNEISSDTHAETAHDNASDNTELDFELFKKFENAGEKKKEDSLFGEILHSKIIRTDIPSYLLQDDLTFRYKKGPVDKIQYYGAYRGDISSIWKTSQSTKYNNLTTQFGMYGAFKNKDYKFKLAINAIPRKDLNIADRLISDAYIINTSIPNHQIIAGYSRVQTGVEGGTSTYILPFVTRSQIAQNFGSARSLAVKVIGNYQYMDYNIAAGSSGRYITRGMPGAEFNGWVNFKPFGNKSKKYGKLVVGGGYNGGHNRIDYSVLGGYVGYNHKKLWTNFEVAKANGYNGINGISSNEACGYAATLGWKFTPHVQLLGRVDQFDPNTNVSHDLQREYTVGLNWFIKGQALKLVLNYVYCDNQSKKDSHKLILATQVLL